ncbi:MAG: hypothetical protein ICV64_03965 [Thermoleophilia bacterium]|nr:hypothetical protein [Thermoleophilia bacterium]
MRGEAATRALAAAAGVAAAGLLLWAASELYPVEARFDRSGARYALFVGLTAGAGLVLSLARFAGVRPATAAPRVSLPMLLLAFLPTLAVVGSIVLAARPGGGWNRRPPGDVLLPVPGGWKAELDVRTVVKQVGALVPVAALPPAWCSGSSSTSASRKPSAGRVAGRRRRRSRPSQPSSPRACCSGPPRWRSTARLASLARSSGIGRSSRSPRRRVSCSPPRGPCRVARGSRFLCWPGRSRRRCSRAASPWCSPAREHAGRASVPATSSRASRTPSSSLRGSTRARAHRTLGALFPAVAFAIGVTLGLVLAGGPTRADAPAQRSD